MVVGDHTVIGANSIVQAVSIGQAVLIGDNCIIGRRCLISHCCKIEDNAVLVSKETMVEADGSCPETVVIFATHHLYVY